jgi:cation diffusion facilitator family transporter
LQSEYKLRALERSAVAIASVVVVEIFLGLAVSSLAILSDGLHALLDTLTTATLLFATRASLKPPDEEHMYGHEKFESVGGLVGGVALVAVALVIIYEAVLKIVGHQTVNLEVKYAGFIAIGYTFCIDFFRVSSLIRARKSESATMRIGFYHALADMSSTVIALLGFGLATLGFFYGDSIASMILGILLTFLSVRLVWSSGMELTDAVSKDVAQKVRRVIFDTKGVRRYGDLRVRKAGEKAFVRASIQVPDYLGLEEAHAVASEVEANIRNILGSADVVIHVEPLPPEMRTERIVKKLAAEVEGVEEVHEINAVYTEGRLHITLHARVDSKLSVEKAHEIAEKIEAKVDERIKDVEDVTVHVEPSSVEARKGAEVNESEVRSIVQKTAENFQHAFRVKGILTYTSGVKRYINIDCALTKQVSIEDAHAIASQIEENIREHFAETTVTVHLEPS